MNLFSRHGLEQQDIRTIIHGTNAGEEHTTPAPAQTQTDTPIFASSAAHSIPLYRRRSASSSVESSNPSPTSHSRYEFRLPQLKGIIHLLTDLNRESEQASPSQNPQEESTGDLPMSDAMDDDDGAAGGIASSEAEPYMTAGYENLAAEQAQARAALSPRQTRTPPPEPTTGLPYAPSRDPIYNPAGWWELGGVKPLEFQYGAFEQMRQLAEATVMHF